MFFRKTDGLFRAECDTDLAALTSDRINDKRIILPANGIKTAHIFACATAGTVGLFYPCFIPGMEFHLPFMFGLEEKMQIRSVHIQITNDFVAGKVRKSRSKRGLAGASLAADDKYFTHGPPLLAAYRQGYVFFRAGRKRWLPVPWRHRLSRVPANR